MLRDHIFVPSILYATNSVILVHFFPASVFGMNDHLGQELGMGGRVGCRGTNPEEPATALSRKNFQRKAR